MSSQCIERHWYATHHSNMDLTLSDHQDQTEHHFNNHSNGCEMRSKPNISVSRMNLKAIEFNKSILSHPLKLKFSQFAIEKDIVCKDKSQIYQCTIDESDCSTGSKSVSAAATSKLYDTKSSAIKYTPFIWNRSKFASCKKVFENNTNSSENDVECSNGHVNANKNCATKRQDETSWKRNTDILEIKNGACNEDYKSTGMLKTNPYSYIESEDSFQKHDFEGCDRNSLVTKEHSDVKIKNVIQIKPLEMMQIKTIPVKMREVRRNSIEMFSDQQTENDDLPKSFYQQNVSHIHSEPNRPNTKDRVSNTEAVREGPYGAESDSHVDEMTFTARTCYADEPATTQRERITLFESPKLKDIRSLNACSSCQNNCLTINAIGSERMNNHKNNLITFIGLNDSINSLSTSNKKADEDDLLRNHQDSNKIPRCHNNNVNKHKNSENDKKNNIEAGLYSNEDNSRNGFSGLDHSKIKDLQEDVLNCFKPQGIENSSNNIIASNRGVNNASLVLSESYEEFLAKMHLNNKQGEDFRKSVIIGLTSADNCQQRRKSPDLIKYERTIGNMSSSMNSTVVDNVFDFDEEERFITEKSARFVKRRRSAGSIDDLKELGNTSECRNGDFTRRQKHRRWLNVHDSTRKHLKSPLMLSQTSRSSSTGSMASIVEVEETDDESSMKEQTDHDQHLTFQQKGKEISDGPLLPFRNKLISRDSSPSSRASLGENSLDAMRISEQDLGSDAESLPSCADSYTASESPPNSPELSLPHNTVNGRRISAPEMMNCQFEQTCQDDEALHQTLRRRNSSVEVRLNKVRFQLEESFTKEASQFSENFEISDENDWPVTVQPSPIPNRKTSSGNTGPERRRKVSVFSDTSEKSMEIAINSFNKNGSPNNGGNTENDSIQQNTNAREGRKCNYQENNLNSRKQSLQEQYLTTNRYDRKISLQEKTSSDRKISLQERLSGRKTSLQERKLSLQAQERKTSHQERKVSLQDRKLSVPYDRKISSNERRSSSSERKLSFSDTVRAVVGTKKKMERKTSTPDPSSSPDENNNTNDKKTTWGILKNKIKKDRKLSAEVINSSPKQSPRSARVLSRNDSTSSIESLRKSRGDSITKQRLRSRTYSEEDRRSVSSFTSFDFDDSGVEQQSILPACSFDVWSEGRVHIRSDNKTLPLLHVAAGEGNYELLKTLIDVGVEVNEIDRSGWPALHYAVCGGHFKCAQLLLENGAMLKNYSNKITNTYCATIRNCIRSNSIN